MSLNILLVIGKLVTNTAYAFRIVWDDGEGFIQTLAVKASVE